MSKWQEDLMYEITMSIKERGQEKEFRKELKKLNYETKWKWRPISEKYEYVYTKINK